jgi:predicted nucleotidyltransferase
VILGIAATYGARDVQIFGSVARGQARPDSDVAFLVDLEPNRTVLDLSGFYLDLQEALGREVNVVESWQLSPKSDGIKREAIPL